MRFFKMFRSSLTANLVAIAIIALGMTPIAVNAATINPSRLPASGWAGNVGVPGGIPTLTVTTAPSASFYTKYCNVLTGVGLTVPATWVRGHNYSTNYVQTSNTYALDTNDGNWYKCILGINADTISPMEDPTHWARFNKAAAGDGVTDDSCLINYALITCPNNQWVYLPAATYRIDNTIGRTGTVPHTNVQNPFSIAIKGDGPGLTNIMFYGGAGLNAIGFSAAIPFSSLAGATTIVSGDVRGSTSLGLGSLNPFITSGLWLAVLRLNSAATMGHDASYMNYCASQLVKVTNVNAGTKTITFWPALNEAYAGDRLDLSVSPPFRCGIEDLYVENRSDNGGNNILFNGGQECWVKNVESYNASRWHIDLNDSAACEVRECEIHDGWSAGGNADYGVALFQWCSQCLVEDNVFYLCRHAMDMEYGGQGNVFGYNYDCDPVNSDLGSGLASELDTDYLMGDQLNHGGSMRYNLREGNVAATIKFDDELGASSLNTVFRCQIQRKGLPPCTVANFGSDIQRWNYSENLVGNVYETQPSGETWPLRRWGTDQDNTPTAVVSGASYSNPVIITFDGSETIATGETVTIKGVGGNLAANVTNAVVTSIDATHFSINGVAGNGAYTGGGIVAAPDANCQATAFLDGECDLTTGTVTWDPSDSTHILPNSYYLTGAPPWFGVLAWPAVNPTNPQASGTTLIPAGYRYVFGVRPPTPPYLLGQPASATAKSGSPQTFSVGVDGYPAPTLQWQVSANSGATWQSVVNGTTYSGATTPTLLISAVSTAMNNFRYRCLASNNVVVVGVNQNGGGPVSSTPAVLTVVSS
jgi:hypothetical protein